MRTVVEIPASLAVLLLAPTVGATSSTVSWTTDVSGGCPESETATSSEYTRVSGIEEVVDVHEGRDAARVNVPVDGSMSNKRSPTSFVEDVTRVYSSRALTPESASVAAIRVTTVPGVASEESLTC